MRYQILFNILIIIWLFSIERRLKIVDKAFYPIGLVITRLYKKVFGENEDEPVDN